MATATTTASRADGAAEAGAAVPRLRGLLHAAAFPAAAAAGVVLIALGPTQAARLAAAVYSVTCMALFGVSAAYHRSPRGSRRRRLLGGRPDSRHPHDLTPRVRSASSSRLLGWWCPRAR